MKIATLGKLTFTYEIYEKYLEGDSVSCDSIQDIVNSVISGYADLGVIPLKNRIVGKINSYNLKDTRIIRKIKLPIKMSIGGLGKEKDIKYVISKKEALEQCKKYIYARKFSVIESESTVKGIEHILKYHIKYRAVICSENALKANGLKIYRKDISDIKPNYTIFGIISSPIIFHAKAD